MLCDSHYPSRERTNQVDHFQRHIQPSAELKEVIRHSDKYLLSEALSIIIFLQREINALNSRIHSNVQEVLLFRIN